MVQAHVSHIHSEHGATHGESTEVWQRKWLIRLKIGLSVVWLKLLLLVTREVQQKRHISHHSTSFTIFQLVPGQVLLGYSSSYRIKLLFRVRLWTSSSKFNRNYQSTCDFKWINESPFCGMYCTSIYKVLCHFKFIKVKSPISLLQEISRAKSHKKRDHKISVDPRIWITQFWHLSVVLIDWSRWKPVV